MRVNSFLPGQRLADTGGLTCGPGDTNSNQLPQEELSDGLGLVSHRDADCVLTTERLLVELHKVGEDVFGDGLLIGETLEQNDHLCLADGVHAFGRHIPALPVHICGQRER